MCLVRHMRGTASELGLSLSILEAHISCIPTWFWKTIAHHLSVNPVQQERKQLKGNQSNKTEIPCFKFRRPFQTSLLRTAISPRISVSEEVLPSFQWSSMCENYSLLLVRWLVKAKYERVESYLLLLKILLI